MRVVLLTLVLLLVAGCVTGNPTGANPQVANPAATRTPFSFSFSAAVLDMRIEPKDAAEFILNPTPLGEDGYPRGMTVTIEVLPKEGWRVDHWAGPVLDVAGNVAEITMRSSHTVVARMKPFSPMATPKDTSKPPTVSVVTKDDNNAPVAVDDIVDWADLIDNGYDIQLLQGITFAVTGNDTDTDGHTLTIDSVTQGVNGSVHIVSGFPGCPPVCGRVTYNPDGSFPPLDTFTYTIGDGYGGTDTGTVRVINDQPLAIKVPKPLVRPTPEGSASSYFKKGEGYNHDGKYQLAIVEFTTAIRLNPGYTSAYWARGWAYDYLNQYQQAIQDFDKAIQLDPYDVLPYISRGFSYYRSNSYQQAIQDFDKAIQLDPYDSLFLAMAYDGRSKAHDRLGNHGIAGADNAKACSLDSQYC